MARRLCHGKFRELTKRLLRDEEAKDGGVAFLSQPCETGRVFHLRCTQSR
jgi:hypothetical protein